MFSIWDSEKLKNLDVTEEFILENSYLPRYQWIEDDLKSLKDKECFSRLRYIRDNLTSFIKGNLNDKMYNNLVICSENLGNGKTSWAVKLMLTYVELQKGKLNS